MIRSIPSSSSLSNSLSSILPLAVEDDEIAASIQDEQPNEPSNTSQPRRSAEKSRKGPKTVNSRHKEALPQKRIDVDLGTRSSTPPIEDLTHGQDKFFGLSQEFSFTQDETDHNPPFRADPSFQSFIETLPEEVFAEFRPQNGRWGLDRYLATPRTEDAVRYFRP
ncbi:hypothetical protein TWF281_002089 [Arthrobotrys megalospora]